MEKLKKFIKKILNKIFTKVSNISYICSNLISKRNKVLGFVWLQNDNIFGQN